MPPGFGAVFAAYRQNKNTLTPAQAEPLASQFTDADWAHVEVEKGRWQSVSERSSIARDCLKIVEVIEPFKPAPVVIAAEPLSDPSDVIEDLVTEAVEAHGLPAAVAPLGSAVRIIDGRLKALEEQ